MQMTRGYPVTSPALRSIGTAVLVDIDVPIALFKSAVCRAFNVTMRFANSGLPALSVLR